LSLSSELANHSQNKEETPSQRDKQWFLSQCMVGHQTGVPANEETSQRQYIRAEKSAELGQIGCDKSSGLLGESSHLARDIYARLPRIGSAALVLGLSTIQGGSTGFLSQAPAVSAD